VFITKVCKLEQRKFTYLLQFHHWLLNHPLLKREIKAKGTVALFCDKMMERMDFQTD